MHNVITGMVDVNCAECGLLFSVTTDFRRRRYQDHDEFHCPMGHINYWPQESDVEKLKRELQAEKNHKNFYKEEAKQQRRSAKAHKGHNTRMKNRIAKGVCPCCNRTFTNSRMARHIATQHPKFLEKK